MAKTRKAGDALYRLEGTLLEACSCNVLCPCWIGEDPDGGECLALEAYHIDRGEIDGVDVSGLTYVQVELIPGNVLEEGTWRQLRIIDAKGTEEQRRVLLSAFRGEYGGPLADLASLVGEELGVEYREVHHDLVEGKGSLRIDGAVDTEMEPYRGPDGAITTLVDSIFSSVPGSPAWVAKATHNRVALPDHGFAWDFQGRNAIQAVWKLEHRV